jgi:hypothetical protein
MPKQQPWMISYEYETIFARGNDGGSASQGLRNTTLIIEMPPWKFIAQAKLDENKAWQKPYARDGERLPDRITAVYWAVQIPFGGLTEEEMDGLS